jgi:hypothetical protein
MTALALARPETVARVRRSELRDNQKEYLMAARGTSIVEVDASLEEEKKYVVDKQYFDELVRNFRALLETLEIIKDQKLFNQILRASATMDEDIRLGKLHSFEEAFGDE